jgi:hypothetical protein
MRPEVGDSTRSAIDHDDRGIPGAWPRLLCLVPTVVLLVIRLTVAPGAAQIPADLTAAGFGLIVIAGTLHALALRWPHRYAVNGAAWVATVVAFFAVFAFAIAGAE